jgi:hypothetical protein
MNFQLFLLIKIKPKLDFGGNFHLDIYGAIHIHLISFEKEGRKFQLGEIVPKKT